MAWGSATPPVPVARSRSCRARSEEHTSELQSRFDLVCRLLLEKKKAKAEHYLLLDPIRFPERPLRLDAVHLYRSLGASPGVDLAPLAPAVAVPRPFGHSCVVVPEGRLGVDRGDVDGDDGDSVRVAAAAHDADVVDQREVGQCGRGGDSAGWRAGSAAEHYVFLYRLLRLQKYTLFPFTTLFR